MLKIITHEKKVQNSINLSVVNQCMTIKNLENGKNYKLPVLLFILFSPLIKNYKNCSYLHVIN